MGAWSEENFGNDDACDWIWELEKSKGVDTLMSPLKLILSSNDYLESPECSEALAAAEVVASGITGDTSSIPEEAQKWLNKKQGLFRKKPQIEKDHALIAKQAVEKVLKNSELKELWEETEDYSNWQKTQSQLIEKLCHGDLANSGDPGDSSDPGNQIHAIQLNKFVEHLPSTDTSVVGKDLCEKYKDLLPEALLELWKTVGIGKYGNGLIELVNPDDYKSVLYGWLLYDEEDESRLPIALSPFGTMFYYRKLSDSDEDVAFIDPQHRESDVLAWSLDEFFNDFMCDPESINTVINEKLYKKACKKHGSLANGEIFYFEPALALGGSEKVENIGKGNANIHLDILLKLALG